MTLFYLIFYLRNCVCRGGTNGKIGVFVNKGNALSIDEMNSLIEWKSRWKNKKNKKKKEEKNWKSARSRREERDALRTRDREKRERQRERRERERERVMEFRRSQRRMRGALLTTKRARRFVATVTRTIQDQAAQGPSSNGTPSPGDAAQAAAKGAAAEAAKKSAKKASGGSLKTWWKQFDKAGRELSAAVVKKVRYFIFFFLK